MKRTIIGVAAAAALVLSASSFAAPAAWGATTLGTSIETGTNPADVAFSPDGLTAYVPNTGSRSISVIDVAAGSVSKTITLDHDLGSIAISPDGTRAYVVEAGSADSIAELSLPDGGLVRDIPVALTPTDVAFSPRGDFAYVTNGGDDSVSVIDVATGTALNSTIAVDSGPNSVAFSPDGSVAYVGSRNSDNLTVIDAATNRASGVISLVYAAVASHATGIAFTPDSSTAYVALDTRSVAAINVAHGGIDAVIDLPGDARSVAVSPNGSTVFVTLTNTNEVAVIDVATNAFTYLIDTGTAPVAVAFSPQGTAAYVANNGSNSVTVINFDPALVGSRAKSTVSASVVPGSLTASLGEVTFAASPFSHGEVVKAADTVLVVDDQTGLLYGWDVTLQASALVWTSPSAATDSARDIPAGNLSVVATDLVATVLGDAFDGATTPGAVLDSAASIISTVPGRGSGSYSVPLRLRVTIPANAAAGSYVGTLTTTISAAP